MNETWFNKSTEETCEILQTNINTGLDNEQIQEKINKYGENKLKEKKKKSLAIKFLEQFKDFMIIVLIIAALISGAVGIAEGEGITDTINCYSIK